MPIAALLLAQAAPLPPGDLLDVMTMRCAMWTWPGDGIETKPAMSLVMGYVRGYVQMAADACDAGAGLGFCTRLRTGKVKPDLWLSPGVVQETGRLCKAHPQATLRQVATRILINAGVKDER